MRTKENNTINIPALAMRGLVIYPGMVMHFDVGRERSISAIKEAMSKDRRIFLVTQRDMVTSDPDTNEIYKIGVVAEIRQVLKTAENATRILVEGIYKAKLNEVTSRDPFLEANVVELVESDAQEENSPIYTALVRMTKKVFERYCNASPKMPKELMNSVLGEENPQKIFDNIVFNIVLSVSDKQKLLELSDTPKRLEGLIAILSNETKILVLEQQIHDEVKEQIDRNQREYYLREQMRVISTQLGDNDGIGDEIYDYFERISRLKLTDEVYDKLYKEADKLLKMPPSSHEATVIRTYLDTCLELPWNKSTKDKLDIVKAQKNLDKDHYGLKKVKERILELLAVRALTPDVKGQIICLVGPPGVGKTSIGRSIANALGRKYARISLGGVRDESDIRGHRKTYIGAMPGRIINAIKTAKSNNPLILLDEIDKMSNDFRGDPSAAMLEVLDSEQNIEFRDHYIEVPFDLSDVLFVTTANSIDSIPAPLLDRMEIIEIGSYTREEKYQIAKRHLIPKQLKKHGLKASIAKIQDNAAYALIDSYTREAGVRRLERTIAKLYRMAAKEIVSGDKIKVTISVKNIEGYLGPKKYLPDLVSENDEVGVVNGLAWTSVGGVIMPIEVLILEGTGKIELTGSLGEVMRESAKIAVSYVRNVATQHNINPMFYKDKDIHIHAPEGAVPKDGPSAGTAMTIAIISALSGRAIKREVAMTGEVTLHGKVLPIGGLREKTMAAYKAGIKTVIIPKDNMADVSEIDDIVKDNLKFVYAGHMTDVIENALVQPVVITAVPDEVPAIPQELLANTTETHCVIGANC